MAGPPGSNDELTIFIMTGIFGLTYIWFIFFCYKSFHKKKAKARRRRKTFDGMNRRTVKSRSMQQRVMATYHEAKHSFDSVMMSGLERNAHSEIIRQSTDRVATLYWVVVMSIMERFDSLLFRKGKQEDVSEDMKELGMTLAYTEGAKGEIDELIEEAANPAEADVDELTDDLAQLCDRLGNIAAELGAQDRMSWTRDGEEVRALEQKLQSRMNFTSGPSPEDGEEETSAKEELTLLQRIYVFFFRQHFIFYFVFWGLGFGIILSHWAYIGSGRLRGGTFLSVPGQYDLANSKIQSALLPIVFGFMHCALYLFGLIPVCFTRGLHRDLLKVAGWLRVYIPFDDMFYFHQLVGTCLIACLFIASNFWIVMMGISCLNNPDDAVASKACNAFNPIIKDAKRGDGDGEILFDSLPGANYFDPRDNVLFLREIVWTVWFFVMPLIYWRGRPNANLPSYVKRNWWEILYYLHLFGAVASILLALYARFEVFYPMLIGGWSFWFFDKTREALFKTYHTDLYIDAQRPSESSYHIKAATGQPTVLAARFQKPKHMDHGKGQWLYVQVPEIDWVWHPFSLASASGEPTIQLLMGIQGQWELKKNGEWVQDPRSATWTYKLLQKFKEAAALSLRNRQPHPIRCLLRGPYGSPFQKCFDARYPAVIIIGAGTGLTSALSVLKETIQMRQEGKMKKHVWFVWSCRRIDDLLMCWRALHTLLFEATKSGAIDFGDDFNPMTSVLLDWLSITIYVTQADKDQLLQFLDNSMAVVPTKAYAVEGKKVRDRTKSRLYRMMTFKSGATAPAEVVTAAPPRPPKASRHRRVPTSKPVPGRRRPTYIPPPAFDETEELGAPDEEAMVGTGSTDPLLKQGLTRWKAACLRAQLNDSALEKTGASLDNQAYGSPGDYFLREAGGGDDDAYVLIIVIDPALNQFEFHLLKKKDGVYTIDGQDLRVPCKTIETVCAHLSANADHTGITLQKSHDPTSRQYMEKSALELFKFSEEEVTKNPIVLATGSKGKGRQDVSKAHPTKDISTWMKEQVLATSMDNKGAHVGRLFQWVRQFCDNPVNAVKGGHSAKIAICFCGPATLAHVIGSIAEEMGGDVEFSAEHI